MGLGVGFTESAQGRIIALVAQKRQQGFRLSNEVIEQLQRLSEQLGKPRPDVVELAITHLSGTLAHDQPVYLGPPPKSPASHKKARRVA
jgi:hypothetical protein